MNNTIDKKPHPWAKCMDCHAFFVDDDTYANKSCPVCKKGTVNRESRTNTWFVCQGCHATGTSLASVCEWCKGKGWLFTEFFQKPSNL